MKKILLSIFVALTVFVQLGMVKELKVTGCRRYWLNNLR